MLQAMDFCDKEINKVRKKQFNLDIDYFFVEKSESAFQYLQKTINDSPFAKLIPDHIHLINGEFVSQVNNILNHVHQRGGGSRALFILDQFGYSKVPFPQICEILSRCPNAEIILTFATDSLIDYLSGNDQTQQILETVGLNLSGDEIERAKQKREWRLAIQQHLHKEIHLRSSAKYYTPFFIRSPEAHRDFWLIHLSGHATARDVMVGVHWQENTHFAHYGKPGLQMLGYDEGEDSKLTNQPRIPFHFDSDAESLSKATLFDQLPDRISEMGGEFSFSDFFSSVTNECPVTSDIMKNVLSHLKSEHIIKITDKTGGTIRTKGIQENSDIISIPRQKTITFPK